MSKIIQISANERGVYALCEDGTILHKRDPASYPYQWLLKFITANKWETIEQYDIDFFKNSLFTEKNS
jgi:hypothetical protein